MTPKDRTDLVPPHTGNHVLPNSPFWGRLLRFVHHDATSLAVRDINLNVEKTYIQLLSDVLVLRESLRSCLSPEIIQDIDGGTETFIGVLAPGGYEFAVAVLTILALGAAVVPMSTAQLFQTKLASFAD